MNDIIYGSHAVVQYELIGPFELIGVALDNAPHIYLFPLPWWLILQPGDGETGQSSCCLHSPTPIAVCIHSYLSSLIVL